MPAVLPRTKAAVELADLPPSRLAVSSVPFRIFPYVVDDFSSKIFFFVLPFLKIIVRFLPFTYVNDYPEGAVWGFFFFFFFFVVLVCGGVGVLFFFSSFFFFWVCGVFGLCFVWLGWCVCFWGGCVGFFFGCVVCFCFLGVFFFFGVFCFFLVWGFFFFLVLVVFLVCFLFLLFVGGLVCFFVCGGTPFSRKLPFTPHLPVSLTACHFFIPSSFELTLRVSSLLLHSGNPYVALCAVYVNGDVWSRLFLPGFL